MSPGWMSDFRFEGDKEQDIFSTAIIQGETTVAIKLFSKNMPVVNDLN